MTVILIRKMATRHLMGEEPIQLGYNGQRDNLCPHRMDWVSGRFHHPPQVGTQFKT